MYTQNRKLAGMTMNVTKHKALWYDTGSSLLSKEHCQMTIRTTGRRNTWTGEIPGNVGTSILHEIFHKPKKSNHD